MPPAVAAAKAGQKEMAPVATRAPVPISGITPGTTPPR
jgi:hypothetical protein